MIARLSTKRIFLLVLVVILIGMVVMVNFCGLCDLEAVTLDGSPLEGWEEEYGLNRGSMLLRQPLDNLAAVILADDEIVKVDIDYRLPRQIEIRTNRFAPVCLVLDSRSGTMKGLTAQGRIVLLEPEIVDWENPVLVNLVADSLYGFCSDHRVRGVIRQLAEVRENYPDLYRLIDEIDFVSPDCLTLSFSGLPYRLRLCAGQLARQLEGFVVFLEQFHPNLDDTRTLDLRFDDMIIQEERARSHG